MEDGEKTPDERLRLFRERRENLRIRVAKIGGQAALGIHPSPEQQSEPLADLQSGVHESESPMSDDQ